ncbi:MAG: GNAT family N-acetyltransferase [Bacteroidales bacterium]|nr:GNAT family N-acetyltransferase [Bacteroidales bacterium]
MLETHRLILRPWRLSDAPKLYEALQNTTDNDYMPLPHFKDDKEARDYIINTLSNKTQFAVADKESDIIVGGGTVALTPDSEELPKCGDDGFLDFWIATDKRHQNLADELVEVVLSEAFITLKVRSLWCRAIAANYAAHNLLMEHGFLPSEQYSRTFTNIDDEKATDILYLTANNWASHWGITLDE